MLTISWTKALLFACSTAVIFGTSFGYATVSTIDIHVLSAPERYYVTFAARPRDVTAGAVNAGRVESLTGHAFVTLTMYGADGKIKDSDSFGLYPESGLGVFGAVPSKISNELTQGGPLAATDVLTVQVDAPAYASAKAYKATWQTSKASFYRLGVSDCVSFVQGIAVAIGLNAPPRTFTLVTPVSYIRALIRSVSGEENLPVGTDSWTGTRVTRFLLTGNGTLTRPDGIKVFGRMVAGKLNGPVSLTFPNLDKFVGVAKDGILVGGGTYSYANGARVEAESYATGVPNGKGRYIFANGDILNGTFQNGQFAGQGSYTRQGKTYEGSFDGTGEFHYKEVAQDGQTHERGAGAWDLRNPGGSSTPEHTNTPEHAMGTEKPEKTRDQDHAPRTPVEPGVSGHTILD